MNLLPLLSTRCSLIAWILCFSSLSIFTPAHSASILWGSAQDITSDEDILNTGTLKYAYRITGSAANSAVVVNSVTFKNIAPVTVAGTNLIHLDGGNVTFSNTSSEETGRISAASLGIPTEGPYLSLNAGYRGLLNAVGYNVTTSGNLLITLNNLVIGETYRVQIWANESRTPTSRRVTLIDNNLSLKNNIEHITGGLGQFGTGTFTADATSQIITINRSHYINGFSVFAVPEPQSLPMLGFLGVMGYILARRKR